MSHCERVVLTPWKFGRKNKRCGGFCLRGNFQIIPAITSNGTYPADKNRLWNFFKSKAAYSLRKLSTGFASAARTA